jgi:putative transposase
MNKKELSALVDQASNGITNEDDMAEAMKFIRKSFYEKALNAELDDHLGYQKHAASDAGNTRNGHSSKTVYSDSGALEIQTPRDRNGDFEPQAIKKRQTRLPLMNAKIIYLYSKGMSTREISETLEELYDTEVSAALISRVTDAVLEQVIEWQSRPLDDVYPIIYLDCIVVKIRQDKRVINKAIYLALGVNMQGHKELLGLWMSENEGAKFWLSVLTELQNRGVKDILIACVDGQIIGVKIIGVRVAFPSILFILSLTMLL